jgi:hypothetical protein
VPAQRPGAFPVCGLPLCGTRRFQNEHGAASTAAPIEIVLAGDIDNPFSLSIALEIDEGGGIECWVFLQIRYPVVLLQKARQRILRGGSCEIFLRWSAQTPNISAQAKTK